MINKSVLKLAEELTSEITAAYEESVTIPQAEKLAAKFLSAQMKIATELAIADLDARMKKAGAKRIRAAVYYNEATKDAKKPSDAFLQAIVDASEIVEGEQKSLDEAEVDRDLLENYFSIFREAHIYFRGIAKGRFDG